MEQNKKDALDQKWKQIAAKAVTDDDFKKRLVNDPVTVMVENGLSIPEGTEAKIGTGREHKLILPKDASEELLEEARWWTWRLNTIQDFGKEGGKDRGRHIAMTTQEEE